MPATRRKPAPYQPSATLPWTRNPLRFIKRRLAADGLFDEDAKSHVMRWIDDFSKHVVDDPRAQAIGQAVMFCYAQQIRTEVALLRHTADSPEAEKLGMQYSRWLKNLTFSLRLSGLRGVMNKKRGQKKEIFDSALTPANVNPNRNSPDSDGAEPKGPDDENLDEDGSPEDAAA